VAERFKNEENILGYEIINEPISANYQRSKIDFLWPGWGNNHLIMNFYKYFFFIIFNLFPKIKSKNKDS